MVAQSFVPDVVTTHTRVHTDRQTEGMKGRHRQRDTQKWGEWDKNRERIKINLRLH